MLLHDEINIGRKSWHCYTATSDVVPRGTEVRQPGGRIFTAVVSTSTPDVLALASVSTNLPRSCYCLEAPIPEKLIWLPQLIAFIKVIGEKYRWIMPEGYEPQLHYM